MFRSVAVDGKIVLIIIDDNNNNYNHDHNHNNSIIIVKRRFFLNLNHKLCVEKLTLVMYFG